jgi:hypothetical protein
MNDAIAAPHVFAFFGTLVVFAFLRFQHSDVTPTSSTVSGAYLHVDLAVAVTVLPKTRDVTHIGHWGTPRLTASGVKRLCGGLPILTLGAA